MNDIVASAKREKIRRMCASNPIYFINNFVKTYDPRLEEPYIPFKLYEFQEEFVTELHKAYINKYDIFIDKSRDMGATWCVLAYLFWHWVFTPGMQFLVGSKKEDNVDKNGDPDTLFGKFDIMYKNLPDFLQASNIDRTHMRIVNRENNTIINGESSNQDFAVSGRYRIILMDEFSKWDNDDRCFRQTADSSPCRIILGTPSGLGNTFADIRFSSTTIKGEITERGQRRHLEFHWRLHPDKGKDAYFCEEEDIWKSPWYDNEIKRRLTSNESSIKDVKQELDIHYVQSGDPVFDYRYLKKAVSHIQHPSPFENYAIGVDFSQGIEGGDNQSIDILAKSTGIQVFHWKGKKNVHELTEYIVSLAYMYNEALIGVERNNGGQELINRIKETGYKNMYMQKKYNQYTDQRTTNLGWYTDGNSKSILILDMQAALITGDCRLTYDDTLDEFMIYQVIKSENSNAFKYGAPKGKHDDQVMSMCIAWQVLKDVRMPESMEEYYKKKEKKRISIHNKSRYISDACAY